MTYTILFAVLLVAIPLAFIKVMTVLNKRKQQQLEAGRYLRFKQVVRQNHLQLSHINTVKDQYMGIDSHAGKLLLAHSNGKEHLLWEIIDIYGISECSVYSINGLNPDEQHQKETLHTKELGLRLHFYYDREPIDIVFYQSNMDDLQQLQKAETLAGKWERILFKHLKVMQPPLAMRG